MGDTLILTQKINMEQFYKSIFWAIILPKICAANFEVKAEDSVTRSTILTESAKELKSLHYPECKYLIKPQKWEFGQVESKKKIVYLNFVDFDIKCEFASLLVTTQEKTKKFCGDLPDDLVFKKGYLLYETKPGANKNTCGRGFIANIFIGDAILRIPTNFYVKEKANLLAEIRGIPYPTNLSCTWKIKKSEYKIDFTHPRVSSNIQHVFQDIGSTLILFTLKSDYFNLQLRKAVAIKEKSFGSVSKSDFISPFKHCSQNETCILSLQHADRSISYKIFFRLLQTTTIIKPNVTFLPFTTQLTVPTETLPPGLYDVTILLQNNVSSTTLETKLEIASELTSIAISIPKVVAIKEVFHLIVSLNSGAPANISLQLRDSSDAVQSVSRKVCATEMQCKSVSIQLKSAKPGLLYITVEVSNSLNELNEKSESFECMATVHDIYFITFTSYTHKRGKTVLIVIYKVDEGVYNIMIEINKKPVFNIQDIDIIMWGDVKAIYREASLPFDASQYRVVFREHEFDLPGIYSIRAQVSDAKDKRTLAHETDVVVTNVENCNMNVRIRDGRGDVTDVLKVTALTLAVDTHFKCSEYIVHVLYKWSVYDWSPVDASPDPSSKRNLSIPLNTSEVTFTHLPPAQYLISVKVTLVSEKNIVLLMKEDFTRVEIIEAKLQAAVCGGNSIQISYSTTQLILDGSCSVTHGSEVSYSWNCARHRDNLPRDPGIGKHTKADSCFGLTHMHFGNISIVILKTTSFRAYDGYYIRMFTTSPGYQTDYVDVVINVLRRISPDADLRCLVNCGKYLQRHQPLILELQCTSCHRYTWSVASCNSNKYCKLTSDEIKQIPYGSNFTVTATGFDAQNRNASVTLTRRMHVAVPKGACVASPQKGIALQTKFNISCVGRDHLFYKFLIVLEEHTTLIQYGYQPSLLHVYLPHRSKIKVHACDVDDICGDDITVQLQVSANDNPNTDDIITELSGAATSENIQRISQLVAALSLSSSSKLSDMVKGDLITKLARVKFTSPHITRQIADIIAFVTKDSSKSQTTAIGLLKKINNWTIDHPLQYDVISSIITSSLTSLSNIVQRGKYRRDAMLLADDVTNHMLKSVIPKQPLPPIRTDGFEAVVARYGSNDEMKLQTEDSKVSISHEKKNADVQNLKVMRFNSSNVNFSTESVKVDDVISVDLSVGWEGQNKLLRPVQFSLKNSVKESQITRIKLNSSNGECVSPCEPKVEGYVLISLNTVRSDVITITLSANDIAHASRVVMTLLEVKPISKNKVLKTKIIDVRNMTSLNNYVWSVVLAEFNTGYDVYNFTIEVYLTSQYSITIDVGTYGSQCLFWTNNDWSNKGCKVVPTSDSGWTKCECDATATSRNSLTSSASMFATQFIVYPNKIDFNKVSWNLPAEFRENPVVMSTTALFYAFFIVLLIWARKRDKEDFAKLPYYEVEDNSPVDRYRYLVVVYTGSRHGAGTTASVVMTIVGNHGSSKGHLIQDKEEERLLTQGSVVNFLVTTSGCLGDIVAVRLWHDNAGRSPEWFLDRLMIWDLEKDTCWFVIATRWLAEETVIDALLHIATAKELHTFRSLFTIKSDSYLRERHLWYSLIGMRPWSCYEMSRCQRVGCCALTISILMLTSLMFHGVTNNGGPQLDLGYYSFRWSHVGVGLESAILCFPVTYVVTSLFRLSRDRDYHKRRSRIKQPKNKYPSQSFYKLGSKLSSNKLSRRQSHVKHCKSRSLRGFIPSSRNPTSSRSSSMTSLHPYKKLEMMTIVDVNPNSTDFKPLPWWCSFIGWMLVGGISSGCSVLSIMYGMTYGLATSREWLVSLLSGFLEEILFLEPAQALLLAYFVVINNPRHDLRDWIPPIHCRVEPRIRKHPNRDSRQILNQRSSNPAYKPPDIVSVKEALEMRAKLRRARRRIKNLCFHIIFLVLLAIVAFGQHDHSHSRYSRTLHNMMDKKFFKIKSRNQIYDWLHGPMIDRLYGEYAHYFTDGQLVIVTPPSLRQQRIKSGHLCPQDNVVKIFYKNKIKCEDPLNAVTMETNDFKDGWKTYLDSDSGKASSWTYQYNAIALGALPLVGEHGTYSNDGYVTHLSRNKTEAQGLIIHLKSMNWIDELTRLVVVESVLYNSGMRLFCVLQMAIETPNMGVVHLTSHMHIMRAHHVITSWDFVVYISLFVALAMVLFFSVNIVRNAHEEGLPYFANLWHLLEIFTLVTSVSSAVIFLTKASVTDLAFEACSRHQMNCLSLFQVAASLHYSLICLLAYTLFFTTLRTVAIMEGHPMFFIVGSTLKRSALDLGGHAVFLFVTYIAFCHMGVIMFRDTLDFSNVLRTMLTVFSFAAEAYGASVILKLHPLYSGCYLFMFFFIFVKCLINFAAVILENAFRESKIMSRDLTREDVFSLGRKQMRSLFAVKQEKLMKLGEGENPYEEVLKVPEYLARRRVSRTCVK